MATLAELQTLLNDPTLRDKVKAAVVVSAKNVQFEDAGTANHANRLKWAKSVMNDPNGWADRVTRFVVSVHSADTLAELQSLSDADVQGAVDLGINLFADGE